MIPIDYIVDNCTEQDYEDYMNEPVDIKAWAAETVSELALRSDYEARVLHLLARVTGLMKDLEQERRASDDRDRLAARVAELENEIRTMERDQGQDSWAHTHRMENKHGPQDD